MPFQEFDLIAELNNVKIKDHLINLPRKIEQGFHQAILK